MHDVLRQLVLDELKKTTLKNELQVLKHFEHVLGSNLAGDHAPEIIDLWRSHQKDQRQFADDNLPPSPIATSAAPSQRSRSGAGRPLRIFPECPDGSDPQISPFFSPRTGSWYMARSKSHDAPGSYILCDALSTAGIPFQPESFIQLQWRPPVNQLDSAQLECTTLFNILSGEEASELGMAQDTFQLLYGKDYNHQVSQQHKAERKEPSPIPPQAPTPPNRSASPTGSTISYARSERVQKRRKTPQAASTFRLEMQGQWSLEAANPDDAFYKFASGILTNPCSAVPVSARGLPNPEAHSRGSPQPSLMASPVMSSRVGHNHTSKRKAESEASRSDHRRQRRDDATTGGYT